MDGVRCADASLDAGEELGGTGIVATRWLCVESREAWGHDAVETGFPKTVSAWLGTVDAKVLAIRRPGHSGPLAVLAAETTESGSSLRKLELDDVDDLPGRDPWSEGERLSGPMLLVCTHGRRDACCSRLGIPVFHALEAVAGHDRVWQCSHTGGHRFAANVIGLSHGIMLGRVEAREAAEVVGLLVDGRLLLTRYRGRSCYDAPVQAAEVAIRHAHAIDRLDGLRVIEVAADRVVFETAAGARLEAFVEETPGPVLAKSCGAEPEPVAAFRVVLT